MNWSYSRMERARLLQLPDHVLLLSDFSSQCSFTPTTSRVSRFYAIPRPVICIIVAVNINCCVRISVVVNWPNRGRSHSHASASRSPHQTMAWSFLHFCHACISAHYSPSIVPMQAIPSPSLLLYQGLRCYIQSVLAGQLRTDHISSLAVGSPQAPPR